MDALARPRPTRPLAAALAVTLLATCAGPHGAARARAPAAAGERRAFPVLQHGALDVEIPAGWTVKVLELEPGTPASVRMDTPEGGALFLAPLYNPEPPVGSPGLETARAFAELALAKSRSMAAPPPPQIQELSAPDGMPAGYWFVATDRDYVPPAPGEQRWRNMLRGAVSVGRLLVTFSWFDDRPGPDRDRAIALVAGARHRDGVPSAAPPEAPSLRLTPDPGVETVPLAVASPGGTFTVLVELPGFQMFAPRPPPAGEGVLVLGQHPETGIVASVTITVGNGAADARRCRDRKLEGLRREAPDLFELRLGEWGPAARASYALRKLKDEEIRQEHAHAFLARDAWCVDVQVSKAAPEAGDAARLEAILASVRFAQSL